MTYRRRRRRRLVIGGPGVERERFLGRVAAALRGADLPDLVEPDPPPKIRFDDPVGRFEAEAEAASAVVTRIEPAEVVAIIRSVFEQAGERRYLAWDGLDDWVPDLTAMLEAAGLERVDAGVSRDPVQRKLDHARVGDVTVGITGTDVGIAASGSLVLRHGPGRPRSASLLVERHIALLPADRIVHSLADAVDRVDLDATSNVAVVTGPSRTGDIDSILTLGVHGPHHLHIVVVDEGEGRAGHST